MEGSRFSLVTSVFLLILNGIILQTNAQSTSSQPPGYYAGYLNRYTKENQCVYSFVVPKKDSDQCPGIKATVEHMQTQIEALQTKQMEMMAIVNTMNDNTDCHRKLGELASEVSQLEREKSKLVADVSRLEAEKDSIDNRRTQLEIELQDYKSQLQELNARYQPLSSNHTQLKQEYNRNKQEFDEMRISYDKLKEDHKTLQRAKNCSSINKHLPSCAAIKRWGYTKSGYSMIDPDGEGGVEPFIVYCDMEKDPSTGITRIEHTHVDKSEVQGCESAGCLSQTIDYKGVSIPQITKLIDLSIQCEQHIRYDCYDSKLLKDSTGWWVSRNGRQMTYWGGASPGSNKCSCGEIGNCTDPNEVCNCDADSESWLFDEGYLRDKNTLPVTQLRFGDVSPDAGEEGKSTLGHLECKWDVNMPVPSCKALQKAGVIQSGVYKIDSDGLGPIEPTFETCDLGSPLPSTPVRVPTGSGISPSLPIIPISTSNDLNYTIPQIGNLIPLPKNPNKHMYEFTNCGQTHGRVGPTGAMCNFTYQFTSVRVSVVEGLQSWKVPLTGRYRVVAKGPAGQQFTQSFAGRGAVVRGEFKFKRGVELKVVIGQMGTRPKKLPVYGGSGGTYVYHVENWISEPLLIAGGGGSASGRSAGSMQSITDASMDMNGKDSSRVGTNFGRGGIQGEGGERGGKASGVNTSGGGAGIKTDGIASGDYRWGQPMAAKAFTSNGQGMDSPSIGGYATDSLGNVYDGGFGGGGSAGGYSPGGGGGYSGGGGGPDEGYGGGGGSYVNKNRGSSTRIEVTNEGDGFLHVEWLGPAPDLEQEIQAAANT